MARLTKHIIFMQEWGWCLGDPGDLPRYEAEALLVFRAAQEDARRQAQEEAERNARRRH